MSEPAQPGTLRASWRRRAAGYLSAHWRGEHSLGRAFWINATVIGCGADVAAAILLAVVLLIWALWDARILLLPSGVFVWILLPLFLASSVWQTVGVVRSARRALARGARVAPGLALVTIGVLQIWGPVELAYNFDKDLAELQDFLDARRAPPASPQRSAPST